MNRPLNSGDPFPSLTLKLAQGGTLRLPDQPAARYTVLLFYRGHW